MQNLSTDVERFKEAEDIEKARHDIENAKAAAQSPLTPNDSTPNDSTPNDSTRNDSTRNGSRNEKNGQA